MAIHLTFERFLSDAAVHAIQSCICACKSATPLHHHCNTNVPLLQHRCNTAATPLQHRCNTYLPLQFARHSVVRASIHECLLHLHIYPQLHVIQCSHCASHAQRVQTLPLPLTTLSASTSSYQIGSALKGEAGENSQKSALWLFCRGNLVAI